MNIILRHFTKGVDHLSTFANAQVAWLYVAMYKSTSMDLLISIHLIKMINR